MEFDSLPALSHRTHDSEIIYSWLSEERKEYLKILKKIGEGNSRNAYAISSKKALKVATDLYGIDQNKTEYLLLSRYSTEFLPKLFDVAKDFSWIEVELVRPISSEEEIEELTGVSWKNFEDMMITRKNYSSLKNLIENRINFQLKELKNNEISSSRDKEYDSVWMKKSLQEWINCSKNKYLEKLDDFITKSNVNAWEFAHIMNLGKSALGHLVLLDVGKLNK